MESAGSGGGPPRGAGASERAEGGPVRPQPERMQQSGDEGALRAVPSGRPLPRGWDEPVALDAAPATIPDPAAVPVPDDLRSEIEGHMRNYPDRHSAVLPALAAAQRRHGWCSPDALAQVAAVMQVTPAYLSSIASFYDMLRTEPRGSRYVYVCTSVSCHLSNAKAVYDAIWEEARDQRLSDVELREFECLGACDMAPMASIDGRYVGPLSESDAPEIVAALRERREVLPGRGLEDEGYRPPWAQDSPAPDRGVPEHPDVSPAGGTWKDPDAEHVPPARGPSAGDSAVGPRPVDPETSPGGADPGDGGERR